MQSSEIINEDGSSTEGPQLPIPIFFHAIASINSTVSIITGGETNTNSYTNQTWYFNHAKQEFTPGPDLLVGRYVHASATITDQETKDKIVVVAGGYNGSFLDSTEIFLNGEWVAGKNHHRFVYFGYLYLPSLKVIVNAGVCCGPCNPSKWEADI